MGDPPEERWLPHSKFRRGCTNIDDWLRNVAEETVNSFVWRVLIALLTCFVLFGAPIQFWLVPKQGDVAFDAAYMFGFVIFMIDIVFNAYADPLYLACDPCNRSLRDSRNTNNANPWQFWTFGFGSYNFWCDLISSVGFLYDVSFINRGVFATPSLHIELDRLGVPTNFDVAVNSAQPVEQNVNFIVLILKATRVTRLVPSTTVVALSERINFYWYIERLTVDYWWNKLKEWLDHEKRRKNEKKEGKESNLIRRGSWGGLEIASLAAVKVKAEEDRRAVGSRNCSEKCLSWIERGLRFVGVRPRTNAQFNHHIAATKIQRAWRNRLAKQPIGSRSDENYMESRELIHAGNSRDSHASLVGTQRSMTSRTYFSKKTLVRISENRSETEKKPSAETDTVYSGLRNKIPRSEQSQVGTAMAEVTGHRVGVFILLSLLFTSLFTYYEFDSTRPSTMVILHGQVIRTSAQLIARKAVETARLSAVPEMYLFRSNSSYYGTALSLSYNLSGEDIGSLRDREKLRIVVNNTFGTSEGFFVIRKEMVQVAQIDLIATIFVLMIWFFGVAAFAGPIMTFVILPIERMVRLLVMLMLDPLGYQSNVQFKNFLLEEDQIVKKSQWTKEVLKGMETSFLMSTILRIGSLMKVGFGSAGVEIIRNNLQKGQHKNELILNSQGSTVSCIFLFCDIRQFTDATESLQEEVFVFTNRIAAVVHSICHSYGGSANKDVGDAFLVSWLLEDDPCAAESRFNSRNSQNFVAKDHQADKALLSVVKICMALHYDEYYVETMSNHPRTALLNKLKNRPGPIVQMGFGLHAGKAVQGAIGSQRKIDATYVSEAVERAEYLESSTKKYKLQMLMSDDFYRLLHPSNRTLCRKIDQVKFQNEDDDENDEEADGLEGDVMILYTYDMDVDALWDDDKKCGDGEHSVSDSEDSTPMTTPKRSGAPSVTRTSGNSLLKKTRRMSMRSFENKNERNADETRSASVSGQSDATIVPGIASAAAAAASSFKTTPPTDPAPKRRDFGGGKPSTEDSKTRKRPELILPSCPSLYSAHVWLQTDMRRIRRRYTPVFFHTYGSGLERYYAKDWNGAKNCFESILDRFDDGPSHFFLGEMKKHQFVAPPHFQPYGRA